VAPNLGFVVKIPKSSEQSKRNFNEWLFWNKHCNPFCVPTLFCFYLRGLNDNRKYWISIQKIPARLIELSEDEQTREDEINEFRRKIQIITRLESQRDDHHFKAPENFGFNENNQLVMFDYGHVQTRRVIKEFGEKIHQTFDENIKFTEEDLERLIDTLIHIQMDDQKHKK